MTGFLLSDAEARAQRRRTRTHAEFLHELLRTTLDRAATAGPAEALPWLERARRIAPKDGGIALRLAGAALQAGQSAAAADLFAEVAALFGTPEAWVGLATARHLAGDDPAARAALIEALRCSTVTPAIRTLAGRLAGPAGWCGLQGERLVTGSQASRVLLDGVPVRAPRGVLPAGWQQGRLLCVEGRHGPLAGSPLPLRRFGLEGFAEATPDGQVRGWAWYPSDPARRPVLRLAGPHGTLAVRAAEPAGGVPSETPLHRPWSFHADPGALGVPLAIQGPDGRHLLGSPLDPLIEQRAAADPTDRRFVPAWADRHVPRPPGPPARRRVADVVVPVHGGGATTLACLHAVLDALPRGARLIVVDDASPEPELVAALDRLASRRRVHLLRLEQNRGFPGACNAGLAAAGEHDVVLLNSDTLVPPGWLPRLAEAAYAAPDIATATPLSNEGTVVSYPDPAGGNPMPDAAGTAALDALATAANGQATAELPVGVGFCLYLRRDALQEVGGLREDLWAQGYGEETDWCLRARQRGWRHVAAPGLFVAHAGAGSFGPARLHLMRRNEAILRRLHPGYDTLLAAHAAADPLAPFRRRLDAARWARQRGGRRAVLLLTHANGGGVERLVQQRAAALAAAGEEPVILRPARTADGTPAVQIDAFPNLLFPMPDELPGLVGLLRPARPRGIEVHHTLGHHPAVLDLAARLRIEQTSLVHDYARFCGRIALVGPARRYCGEPGVPGCEACLADLGSLLEDDPPVRTLLARSAAELGRSARVIAPSADAAGRLRRHFPAIQTVVEPWENDAALPTRAAQPGGAVCRVVAVGAIGLEKGYEVLLACARDAAARALPLHFTVAGFTEDDDRLMQAGPVFVTGAYREQDAVALVRAQGAHLAFIPSIWPETWCFALTRAWQAGLDAAVFDLGAQAERTRRTGRGWVLPLGLAPGAVNDALLRCSMSRHPQLARQAGA